jgi:8-oxo-dGTP diphosphatase
VRALERGRGRKTTSEAMRSLPSVGLVQRQRVAAYGLARLRGSVLLVRATPRPGGQTTWWLPGGGIHFGESPRDGLVREFVEETGLQVVDARLRDALSDVGPLPTQSTLLHSIRLIYDVTVARGALVGEEDGSTDSVAWLEESGLTELPLTPWLGNYLAGAL